MRVPYEYALVRVVPHVEREEFVNAGVLVFCESQNVLRACIALDEARLVALHPRVDLGLVRSHLSSYESVCRGEDDAAPMRSLSHRERFRWLTAPRNTILQTSPAHAGLTEDLDRLIEHVVASMVRCPK